MPSNEQKTKAKIFDAFSKIGGNGMKLDFKDMEKAKPKKSWKLSIPDFRKCGIYAMKGNRVFINTGLRGTFTQSVNIQHRVLKLTLKKKSTVIATPLLLSTKNALGWDFNEVKSVYRYIADKKTIYFFTNGSLLNAIKENHR
jgi:hypothetical protein